MDSRKLRVHVKWGKNKYENLEIDTADPPLVFKTQIWTLTGIIPERQKILVKGGTLKDDSDWNTLAIKEGQTLMMMGSTETEIVTMPQDKAITFVEDLTDDAQAMLNFQANIPSGLINLGNTCYMNSTLQCYRAIPELQASLKRFEGGLREDGPSNVTVALRDLFSNLSQSNQAVPPLVFLQIFRQVYPQFAQRGENGQFMQQDAEECWSQIFSSLNQNIPRFPSSIGSTITTLPFSSNASSAIGQLFSGEIQSTWINTENPQESKLVNTDVFHKLTCHISSNTSYLMEGLKESLSEKITKQSESLGREALYLKSSQISRLPYYLTIQFVRFYWKQEKKLKAKIVKPVEFPFQLDILELCSEKLKDFLSVERKQLQQIDEIKLQRSIKTSKEQDKKMQSEQKEKVSKRQKVTLSIEEIDPSRLANRTGLYELFALITHKGRMADSGHYVSWVKEDDDQWLKFDDEKVTYVNNEEIKKLSGKGGGDWHMAYLCFYRSKNIDPEDLSLLQSATLSTATSTNTTISTSNASENTSTTSTLSTTVSPNSGESGNGNGTNK